MARNFGYEIVKKDSVAQEIDTQIINKEVHANDGYFTIIDDIKYEIDNSLPRIWHVGLYCLGKLVKYSKMDLANTNIKIRYMGLFDTVASYNNGLASPNFKKGVSVLRLNDVVLANSLAIPEKTVHLMSEDDIRLNFALTPFSKENKSKNQVQIFLPGVNSDIGGGYKDKIGDKEGKEKEIEKGLLIEKMKYVNSNEDDRLNNYRNYLIDSGWFKDSEIYINYDTLYARRQNLSNKYADIPLYFMYEQCGGKILFDETQFKQNSTITASTAFETNFRIIIGKN